MPTPFFTLVMPSYLGDYPNAATQRPEKFRRAVDSVMDQTLMDWELRIVSDGCDVTSEIVERYYAGSCRVHLHSIPKQPFWSGAPRNVGIKNALGTWITYIDTDDLLGERHLAILRESLRSEPPNGWAYFNDLYYDVEDQRFKERICEIDKYGKYGTSNIVHRRDLGVWWPQDDKRFNYAHDRYFVDGLKSKGKGVRIAPGQYFVCHDIKKVSDSSRVVPLTTVAFDV